METGTGLRIALRYQKKVNELKLRTKRMREAGTKELRRLEQQCLKEHGSHLADGSRLTGFCKRCGANLEHLAENI